MQPRFKALPDQSPTERAAFAEQQRNYQWCTLALSLRRDRHQHALLLPDLALYKEIVLDLQCTPPLGMTLDLLALWRQGAQFVPRPLTEKDLPFERFYLRLQNEVYYHLVRMPAFQTLRRRWLALPAPSTPPGPPPRSRSLLPELSLRDQALVYLTSLLFQPIKPYLIDSFRPHELPPFAPENPPSWLDAPLDLIEQLEGQLQAPGWLSLQLNAIVHQWTRQHPAQWLPASAEHILNHFALLPTKLQRIRWQQLAQVDAAIEPCPNLRHFFALRDHGYRESHIPTRSTAPEGGYHGICHTGPMENMLHSELMYWDEDLGEDHFSLRWIEGELLFYEREQSRSFTWQRQLVVVLDLDPGEIRYKHPEHPAPGHTLLFGFLARLFQDLRQICPEELLRFSLRLGPADVWQEDAPLFQLYFSHLPHIGASTTLDLLPDPARWLQQETPRTGELRLLLLSASRWKTLAQTHHILPHHLCMVWSTDPQELHYPHQETNPEDPTIAEQELQPAHRNQVLQMRRRVSETPDFTFFLNQWEDPLLALAQLREDVLESILMTSLVPKT